MAIWTHLLASAIAGSTIRHVCSSGTKFYYVDNGTEDVYEYDPDTNTETLIVDASTITDYLDTVAIAWFNGNLYVFNYYGGGVTEYRVQRWTAPTTLTTVKTFTNDNFGPTQIGMLADSNTLVAFGVDNPASPAAYSAECWYSSDGASWSAGSWNVDVWSPPDLNGSFLAPRNTDFPTGLYREFVTDTNHPTRSATTEKSIFLFSGGVWTKIAVLNTGPNEIYLYSSPNEGVHWTYTTGEYYTDSTFSSTTTIGSSPPQTYQVNMPYSIALTLIPVLLYEYSGGGWILLDTLTATWEFSSNGVMVRMDNGDCYIIVYSSIGAAYDIRIFGRDEPIITECSPAQFYYGIEVPIFTSNLPFCGVNPGGMAISAKGDLAVLGTNAAASQAVVWGAYPFTAEWNDISGIVPTGTAVTSVKFV